MFKKIFLISSCLAIILAAISSPLNVWAADSVIDTSAPAYETGDYSLDNIMSIVISTSGWILGIVGSLALLMFVYGGFMFLISAGSSDKIGQAQKILVAAVIGLIIVFASYMIIRFVAQAVGVDWQGGKIIPASSTTISSTATSPESDCTKTYGSAGFSCRSESGAGFCIANLCGSGANVCCHASCVSEHGSEGYSCINYTASNTTVSCDYTNSCAAVTGQNMKCCKKK